MPSLFKSISIKFSADKDLFIQLKKVLGKYPRKIDLFKTALTQRAQINPRFSKKCPNNERLEYLGDAVVGTIVAEYLYLSYPEKQEGFLTKMRAKIVSRKSMNALSRKSGLSDIVVTQQKKTREGKNAAGNVLEAVTGAMFIDFGYEATKIIFISKFLKFINLNELENEEVDYKSRVLEVAQHCKHNLIFECFEENGANDPNRFHIIIFDNDVKIGEGFGSSKKEASQKASQQVLETGKLND